MKHIYITVYSKEKGKQEFTSDEWHREDISKLTLDRNDGPAMRWEDDGHSVWYKDDKRHRIGGPSLEWADGFKEWSIEDEPFTEKEYNKLIQKVKDMPLALRLVDPRRWVREYKD